MFRGTTPTLTFSLPIQTSDLAEAWITIKQGDVIINKTLTDCEVEETVLSVTLTQNETLLLTNGFPIQVQLRVLLNGGAALATQIYSVYVKDILRDGVIA